VLKGRVESKNGVGFVELGLVDEIPGFVEKVVDLPGLDLILGGVPERVGVSVRSLNLEDFLEYEVFFLGLWELWEFLIGKENEFLKGL
jgi:hypothetical protein